ncbi:hypothetical protein [Ornithinibacillus scapharcae]|uniref:hypothetical protein n=1 Tax=Ornithinibacillus scapharcae TaxID=1147159 RepID=UPI000225B33E|nr:hypothetical protein [Ornithinibacillus scapharcae]
MKKSIWNLLLIGMIIALSSCTDTDVYNDKDIKNFVKEYKTKQYAVENPSNPPTAVEIGERVKPFLTEEEYDYFYKRRYFHFINVVAKNTGYKSKVQDITLEKTEENEDGTVDYDYVLTVEYYHDNFSEAVETKGQLTIQYNGENYKITRDWEQPNQFVQEAILKTNNNGGVKH